MKQFKTVFIVLGIIFILASVYCDNPSAVTPIDDNEHTTVTENGTVTENRSDYVPGIVRLQSYSSSRPAIIFVIDRTGDGVNEDIAERIIRLFAENNANLSLALLPFIGDKDTYKVKSLQYYVEAGVIDVNVNYDRLCLEDDTASCPGMSYEELETGLMGLEDGFMEYYGSVPRVCVLGEGLFCEDTYRALEAGGFKVVTAGAQDDGLTSLQFIDYAGNRDEGGLVRLSFAGNVCARDVDGEGWGDVYAAEADNDLFRAVVESLDENWVAVIEINPEAFAGGDGKADEGKIDKLAEIIRYSSELGDITTYSSWYAYMDKYFYAEPFIKAKETPEYTGKPAIIFRLDDVAKDWYEDTTEQIIQIFKRNDVPLAVGIIPYLSGEPSFDIVKVREYYGDGVVDISMHGFDWTYAQIDTSKSGLTYSELLKKLKNSRRQLKNYYGIEPVTFTVPNDFYDEAGYNAVRDAGFKIFATQQVVESHPSVVPVNYEGAPDPDGMYRIPTASDVTVWDTAKQDWGDVFGVSGLGDIKYYAETPGLYFPKEIPENLPFYNDMYYEVNGEMDKLGIAVLGIHPDAFIDADGKPDEAKLKKLEEVVKWARDFASVTTFDQWYKYTESQLKGD